MQKPNKNNPEVETLTTTNVGAGQSKTIQVGIYESTIPVPKLNVQTMPDVGKHLEVSVSTRSESEDGDYILRCHVQNSSPKPCEVTIRSAE